MALVRCPICDTRFEADASPAPPFCSHRCRRVDLERWLGERYGLPFEPEEEETDFGADDAGLDGGV
jgi:endogenous inhibitor of DNA gyrase (YacG/DUF329 family)